MTLSGTKVECFNELDKNLDKIVVGQIVSVERHPDADKLVVCQVNVGNETVQIVTGAPNIEPEQVDRKFQLFLTADVWLADTMEVHFQKVELRLKKAS